MSESDLAKGIARRAHQGQVDKAGREYFEAHLEPIAAAAMFFGDIVAAAAWLHDVLEDTALTAAELTELGVSAEVVAAVLSVTRRPDEKYSELINRACADPVGRIVKLIDNAWNITSNPVLAVTDPERAQSLLNGRYKPARKHLMQACGIKENSPVIGQVQVVLDAFARYLGRPPQGQSGR